MPVIIKPMPIIVPVFKQEGLVIEYKRFPKDPTWKPLFDMNAGLAESNWGQALVLLGEMFSALQSEVSELQNNPVVVSYPLHMAAFGDEFIKDGGAWSSAVNTAFPYNYVWYSVDVNGTCVIRFLGEPGQWNFYLTTLVSSNASIARVIVNSEAPRDRDMYYNGTNIPYTWSILGVTLTGNRHTLRIQTQGKNPLSSGYALSIIKLWGYKVP